MSVTKSESARGERRATFAFPAASESACLARKMTDEVLHAWACEAHLDMAILPVDEVFANAVLHGVGPDSSVSVEASE